MKKPCARWDTELELRLSEADAARVLNTITLFRLARHELPTVSRSSLERWIHDATAAKRLIKVVRGLYLNRMTTPPAELSDAAMWLRPGAVVSLQTVLGDCGAWNNFTDRVTCVVPFKPGAPAPSLGLKKTQAGSFHFRGMPQEQMDAGDVEDRLVDAVGYQRATPEAALLHWLYLAKSPHSTLGAPPLDLEMTELSMARVNRLGRAMNMQRELKDWLTRKHAHDASPSVAEQTWIP